MKYFFAIPMTLVCLALTPDMSFANDLKPRAEVNMRAGTDRSILMTEFWAPLAQQSDRVLYGDLRLMGDDSDNREGNLGFGYRQISNKTNSVLGANAWIDRRRTENGNHFHQLTLGVESLGDTIDLRANGYIQLNGSKTRITPNIGNTNPYLAGTGIFYDTNGFIIEEPQDGFDAEIGYRLPILQKHIDATRVYAGGYHFWGDNTENVTGFRLRTEAQINSIFSVGARFQHDSPRGSQGFLEATFRFPFKSKKLYQEHGLKSRLDESPERDIDIVTGAKVDTGLMKPVINTTSGTTQRILYVDNTNINAGDGSKDNPFNTLVGAQNALQANDILYISHGDGTTTGMDLGITINKDNVQLIGSGSALTYNDFTLIEAGAAPFLTNITPWIDGFSNNAVTVFSDYVYITGVTTIGALGSGIAAFADGKVINHFHVNNVSSYNNDRGINVYGINGGTIANSIVENSSILNNIRINNFGIVYQIAAGTTSDSITVRNNIITGNGDGIIIGAIGDVKNINIHNNVSSNSSDNIVVRVSATGSVDTATISNNITSNGRKGIWVTANGGIVSNIFINENIANNNNDMGVYVSGNAGGTIGNVSISNTEASGNTNYGVYFNIITNASLGAATISNITANNNTQAGVYTITTVGTIGQMNFENITTNGNGTGILFVSSNSSSSIQGINLNNITSNNSNRNGIETRGSGRISGITISNATTNNNGIHGTTISAGSSGLMDNVQLSGLSSSNNTQHGLYLYSNNGTIGAITLSDSLFQNNTQHGVFLSAAGATSVVTSATISNITASSNTQNGFYVAANGGVIGATTLSNSSFQNNTQQGVFLTALGTNGTLSGVTISNVNASGNSQNGLYIQSNSAAASITNVSVSSSDFLNNAVNGIFVNRSNASAILEADLGGGLYGSSGQNRVFGNTNRDIRASYTGTANTLFATNNWWGNATGLLAGRTMVSGATINATPFLTVDPRP